MINQLDFLKCYYRPAFFQIKIDLPVDLGNLGEVTDGTLSLYLHEYIHFIQDISTIYGLINISTINYYIQDCAARISRQTEKEFSIPLKLIERKEDFGYLNFNLQPIYLGSKINPKRREVSFISYSKENAVINENNDYIETIVLNLYDDIQNEKFNVNLGGNLVTEGMAYLAERYVYSKTLKEQGHYIPVDEYPYCVIEKIAQSIYADLAEFDILLIAICDCCLMTYHPGLSFIKSLEFLKQERFIQDHENDSEIITKLYQTLSAHLKGNHLDFNTVIDDVRKSIQKSFKVEHFEGNNKWIDILFDRIKVFRNNRPEFIVDFLQLGDLKTNELFSCFHKLLGSPLVLNGENLATITLPSGFNPINFQPYLFWAINQMLRIFSNNNPTPCELKDFCKKSKEISDPNIVIDERCDTAPWKRFNDINLCPMGIMWKHWALSGYTPIPEKREVI